MGGPVNGDPSGEVPSRHSPDGRELETEQAMEADEGSPRETEGPEPGPTYSRHRASSLPDHPLA